MPDANRPSRHHRLSLWLLVRGLPRDPHAAPHLVAMLVATVATVLLVRAFLAAAGYPQIGGATLHIAHVLWGGLLMVAGLVLLLSFIGPVIRPIAAVVSGVGIGLFIDEIGKFVTHDNDYFYRPAAAVMYVIVVSLLLTVHLVHRRHPHHPAEHLAAAVDQTVAGVAGGFTPRRRAEVHAQLRRAAGAPGVDAARALVRSVPDDQVELVDPIRLLRTRRLRYRLRRFVGSPRTAGRLPALTAVVLVAQIGYAVWRFLPPVLAYLADPAAHRPPPGAVPLLLGLASTVVCTVLVTVGIVRLPRDATAAYRWFYRALLVNLLFTRVFEFNLEQFLAAGSVLVDLATLGVVTAALALRGADPVSGTGAAPEQSPSAESGSSPPRSAVPSPPGSTAPPDSR